MSFVGKGAGSLSYNIEPSELPVNAKGCTVQVVEDDDAGTLMLTMDFEDPTLGNVQVVTSILNYSSSTHTYQSGPDLTVLFATSEGGSYTGEWQSGTGSSVYIYIYQNTGVSAVTYSGIFNAADLNWIWPSGNREPLTIKFTYFTLTAAGDNPNNSAGDGSITYTIGAGESQTESVTVTCISFYNSDEQIYAVCLTVTWTDPVYGQAQMTVTTNPFTGTGNYSSSDTNQVVSVLLWTAKTDPGVWIVPTSPPPSGQVATLDITYSVNGNGAVEWQGTLVANQMIWQSSVSPGQPTVDLNVSSLTFNLTQAP